MPTATSTTTYLSATSTALVDTSGLPPKASIRDEVYCHLTARRAVARAALHLGVESMTAEAVDVLASCLLEYLQRLGSYTAATAEASGRSSAHCNVYDVLGAAELCTTVTAAHHHASSSSTSSVAAVAAVTTAEDAVDDNVETNGHASAPIEWVRHAASWKDLALFCFGPNWDAPPPPLDTSIISDGALTATTPADIVGGGGAESGNGGKVGPSATASWMLSNAALGGESNAHDNGWNAPYPDEVPPFPLCTGRTANPHTFSSDNYPALHALDPASSDSSSFVDPTLPAASDAETSLTEIPDAAFQPYNWGSMATETDNLDGGKGSRHGEKRKDRGGGDSDAMDDGDDSNVEPPTKKARFKDETAIATTSMTISRRRPSLPSYVPTFFPPFPTKKDGRVVVVDDQGPRDSIERRVTPSMTNVTKKGDEEASAGQDSTRLVRSALVHAYKQTATKSYWGTSWADNDDDDDAEVDNDSHRILQVPAGRPTATETTVTASIVPLNRASGSRVSRILEGSMDPTTL